MIEIGLKLLSWCATAWVHATLMLLSVYLLERGGCLRAPALREAAWRLALLAPLLTATAQSLWVPQPWAGRPTLTLATAADARYTPAPTSGSGHGTSVPTGLVYESVAKGDGRPAAGGPWMPTLAAALAGVGWICMLLALARSTHLLWRWQRERRRVAALPALAEDDISAQTTALLQSAGIGGLRVLRDAGSASPVALSPATICLPPWALKQLGPQQRQAMLAHELAHLQRRDPDWRLLYALRACALWVPFTATARQRLDELAEHACDAWSARRTGNGRALAEALAVCVELGFNRYRVPAFAAAMAQPRSALVERVQRLIEEQPMQFERLSTLRRVLLSSALLAGILALPGLTIANAAIAGVVTNEQSQPPPAPPVPPAPPEPAQPPAPPAPPADPPPPPPPADPAPPPAPPAPPAAPSPPSPRTPPADADDDDDDAVVQGNAQSPAEQTPTVFPFRDLRPGPTELFVSPFSNIEAPGDGC